jgi:LysM repeat protein
MRKATISAVLLTIACIAPLGATAHAQISSVQEVVNLTVPKSVQDEEKVPQVKAAETVQSEPAPILVTVETGDTLTSIAETHATTYDRLFDANTQLSNPNIINPG